MLKRILGTLLKIGISAFLIFLLFEQKDLSLRGIYWELRQADLGWILWGIVFFSASTLLGAIQWRKLMQARQIQLPLSLAISYYYVGLFFNNFLPGYIAGDAFRIYDLTKSSGNNSDAVSTVLVDRLIGFIVLTTMALIASLIWMTFQQFSSVFFFLILIIFLGWMVTLLILFNQKLARGVFYVLKYILNEKLKQKIKDIYYRIHSFKYQRRILVQTLMIALVIQSLRVLTHFAAARALGIHDIPWYYFFIFIPIIALAVTIPVSIGGFGIREQTAVYLFGIPEVGGVATQITTMELLAYLIGILCSLPGGLIFILRQKHRTIISMEQPYPVSSKLNQLKEVS